MESIVGKILCGRYRIIRELNEDDFSTVYLAEDIDESNEQCYIEQLEPHYDNEVLGDRSWQKVLQTFVERSIILKNLSQHPQIPQLLDFFECDREFYLVREYIQGESLAQKLKRTLITEAEAINWLQEILGILEFVHQAKIAHLNIQPSSAIEYRDGRKFLTDFATVKNAISSSSNLSPIIINSDFAAPELKLGRPEYSSDIYALGKTVIYALTGRLERVQTSFATKALKPTESNNFRSNISPELANVLNKMIGEQVGDRYQTTAEVLADLDFVQNVVTFPPPVFDEFGFGSRANSRASNLRDRISTSRFKFGRKITWSLLALPFIVALAIVFIGIDRNSYRRFDNYVNNDYEFTVRYPQDWLVKELNDPITGAIVVFNSPIEDRSDIFSEKVYITIEPLSTEITNLEQYTQTVLSRIEQLEASNVKVYDEFETKTKIDNFPARTVIYSRRENGLSLKQMETFTIRNNRVYTAIYTAQAAEFSEFSNKAQKIINSWEIQ